ncbi:hypothetical protein SARC_02782 [Sphaeroforma arctica JP610]|uniref:Uncharacterized protein n=1 Tax=Sphaeroforma arctica JP610 TaxID=667725 RepID=A0A0L0G9U4_9EUKA|nr:hypothetical protein SARC_02782 [Sphaeroforma arctica JP610]KNC85028.1 hypothetical protein SARC_02782 [Sphaeroforma arctica JP610]|eukprot:XP_014158930.1 hypothetical protein SARC_02782 [Sphaeroforma arctica JP610]
MTGPNTKLLPKSSSPVTKVETTIAKKPAPEDDKKTEIHLELTSLVSEAQYSIKTLGKLRQSPNWISDQEGHLDTMMHVQEATENIHLIQEQLRRLRELSLADIDTFTPHDTTQATVDDDNSATTLGSSIPNAGRVDTNRPVTWQWD